MTKFSLIIFLLCSGYKGSSETITAYTCDTLNTCVINNSEEVYEIETNARQPNPVLVLFKKKQKLNKRITAAVLAFPFPFGIVGLHRIYLGSQPYVPVAYVASLGGAFGILPFIDFCVITFNGKNFEEYKNNPHIFMWLNQ